MASSSIDSYVCHHYFGRLALGAVYRAFRVDDEVIDVKVYAKRTSLGFSEYFRFKFMICDEIKSVYITCMTAWMGWTGCPYDHVLVGFQDVDEYSDHLSNYMLILRDIFKGFDVRRLDDGTYEGHVSTFQQRFKTITEMIATKVPIDIARSIVHQTTPEWVRRDLQGIDMRIPQEYTIILTAIAKIHMIETNSNFAISRQSVAKLIHSGKKMTIE